MSLALPLLLGVCLAAAANAIAGPPGVIGLGAVLLGLELVHDHRLYHQEQADRSIATSRFGEWTDG